MSDVQLTVDGVAHGGWQELTLKLGIEDLAGSFSVGYRDRWAERGEPFPIREGDEVAVNAEGELVLTGYVEDYTVSYDAQGGVKLTASGRGKASNLIDCSERFAPSIKLPLLEIAKTILEPFAVDVSIGDPRLLQDGKLTAPIDRFAVEPGEPVADALTRLVRLRGCMLQSTPKGDLEIVRAGASRITQTSLEYGRNVLSGSYAGSTQGRFSKYTLLAQMPGSDTWSGAQSADIVATVDDPSVPFYRPTVIHESEPCSFDYLKQRGAWERNTRAGRAQKFTYEVEGWTHAPGETTPLVGASLGRAPSKVWRQNRLVRVADSLIGFEGYLLISGVTLTRTVEGGKRATLELCPPETYDILEPPPPVVQKGKRRRPRGSGSVSFNAVTGLPEPSQDPVLAGDDPILGGGG